MVDYQGRFVWYELITTDVPAARAFYAKIVGWGAQDVSSPYMAYTFFTAGNAFAAGLMGLPEAARKAGARPAWIGYVAVDNVDAAVDRIRRLGGAVHVPPTDLLDISRFAIVADPQTAPLALIKWLKPRTQGIGDPSEPGRVGWHELLATDCETAFDFYGQLFGWSKVDAGAGQTGDAVEPYHLIAAGGQTIGGMYTKPAMVPAPLWLHYFNVRDIDAAAARVTAAGGLVVEDPVAVPGGNWIARCTDPQGAAFALLGPQDQRVGYFAPASPRPPKP